MGAKTFSWHEEYYERALKQIAGSSGKQYASFLAETADPDKGWFEYFICEHPMQFKKYEDALIKIAALWGDMEPKAMEEFKKAVKIEVDGTKWAVEKYLDWQRERIEAEKTKGTQEGLYENTQV